MICHILAVPFTGLGLHNGFRGNKWLQARIEIFKRFVVPSLMSQTKREFVIWLCFRPEEKNNFLVKDLKVFLSKLDGLTSVFTFHGIPIYDDKYPDELARVRLMGSLSNSLPELVNYVGDAEWVYLTCQPSDDLYESGAIQTIQSIEPERKKAMGWKKGYIVDYGTKLIAEYNPETTPPFSTIIFPSKVFLDPVDHFNYIGPYESHEYVPDEFNFSELPGRGFCVGTHGHNISTVFNHPYTGNKIGSEDIHGVWLRFGMWDADPLPQTKRPHLILRQMLNLLPRSVQLKVKDIYYALRK